MSNGGKLYRWRFVDEKLNFISKHKQMRSKNAIRIENISCYIPAKMLQNTIVELQKINYSHENNIFYWQNRKLSEWRMDGAVCSVERWKETKKGQPKDVELQRR